jgi:hypothetical protein
VFITAVPIIKLFARGEGDRGGHVLRETTSRGLCGLVWPSRTSERGGEGDCVKEGGGGEGAEGEREGERALGRLLCPVPPLVLSDALRTSKRKEEEERRSDDS